ncbi:riboflavin kinase [Biomphalaria pfeifferi]|uniref:Riboflavin kinase n=1 Tax=Biomphalaria pfeifferi TaxID=112525 RepID=A0AAD8FK20_BIOPF|nr:riboflavin kinase [Biomphalaria pfeifferi]
MSSFECLPYYAEGTVVTGFGRGSKELGIPTANFAEDVVKKLPENFHCGVYFGWAKIKSNDNVFKMTMSIGWNHYYHNQVKTMETHILHTFDEDFYGDHLKIIVLGYIRAMLNFNSLDDLIAAIKNDIAESDKKLEQPEFKKFKDDLFFKEPTVQPDEFECTQGLVGPATISEDNLCTECPLCIDTSKISLCHSVDLEKSSSNRLINGSLESHGNKTLCISNLKIKNSFLSENKSSSEVVNEPNCQISCDTDFSI